MAKTKRIGDGVPLAVDGFKRRLPPSSLAAVWQFLASYDFAQIVPMAALLAVGLVFIYGTGEQTGAAPATAFWWLQVRSIAVGFLVWFVLSLPHYRYVAVLSVVFYVAGIILLVLVLFYGVQVFGARRWLQLGPVRVQPSEFAKLATLLVVSWLMSLRGFDIHRLKFLGVAAAIAVLPFGLIVMEPDLGSAVVMLPAVAAAVFVAGLRWKHLILALALLAVAAPAVYPFLSPYQKERVLVFLDPERDPRNRGWNSLQSELAVGSGGLTGKGFMRGTQNTLGFLPQTVSNTDFIFSVIAEETGFVGAAALLALYAILLASAVRTALLNSDPFAKFFAVGAAALLFTHCFVNIGMSVRLVPITGLPLPLVSYGGSFIVTVMAYLGILQSIHRHRPPPEDD